MGKDFDADDFNIVCNKHAEGHEEEEDDQGSEESDSNTFELGFKLYNHPEYFKITCNTLDFDQDKLKFKPLTSKALFIRKADCSMYQKQEESKEDEKEQENVEPHNQM